LIIVSFGVENSKILETPNNGPTYIINLALLQGCVELRPHIISKLDIIPMEDFFCKWRLKILIASLLEISHKLKMY